MSRSAERALTLGALLALLALPTCYESRGGGEEICNGADDDRNGLVDEPFRNADGEYYRVRHCGGCGIDCHEVFPSAAEVECALEPEAHCAIVSCPPPPAGTMGNASYHRRGAATKLSSTAPRLRASLTPPRPR